MRFKKGDKVWMISTSSAGIVVPSMRGTVSSVNARHYDPPRMLVELENGHTVIHTVEDNPDSIVKFRIDWGSIAQSGRAKGF